MRAKFSPIVTATKTGNGFYFFILHMNASFSRRLAAYRKKNKTKNQLIN